MKRINFLVLKKNMRSEGDKKEIENNFFLENQMVSIREVLLLHIKTCEWQICYCTIYFSPYFYLKSHIATLRKKISFFAERKKEKKGDSNESVAYHTYVATYVWYATL